MDPGGGSTLLPLVGNRFLLTGVGEERVGSGLWVWERRRGQGSEIDKESREFLRTS